MGFGVHTVNCLLFFVLLGKLLGDATIKSFF